MEFITSKSLFQPATGYIRRGGFDFTCNPYVGCTFGCTYCYAMFLPQNRRPKEDWGRWIVAKQNAIELARKSATKLTGKAVYMSSVTDPYLPAERTLKVTRGILEAIMPHQPRLVVQTRGPLVVRDIDVLKQFRRVRINVSIPTDNEKMWAAFEPKSSRLEERWRAASELRDAGLPVGLCLTPLLALEDADAFVNRVIAFRPAVVVIEDFHDSHGGFGADTGPAARALLAESGWSAADYHAVVDRFRGREMPVFEGESGFFPP